MPSIKMPRPTRRNLTILAAVAALGAVGGGGGVALAGGSEDGEPQATGPQADKAKQAALTSIGTGKVSDVSADGGENTSLSDNSDASEPAPSANQAKIAWNVEVTKPDRSTVTVHLDRDFKVVGTESSGHSAD